MPHFYKIVFIETKHRLFNELHSVKEHTSFSPQFILWHIPRANCMIRYSIPEICGINMDRNCQQDRQFFKQKCWQIFYNMPYTYTPYIQYISGAYIYIYIYTHLSVCIYIFLYIYIHTHIFSAREHASSSITLSQS